jgi:hypothetical protein
MMTKTRWTLLLVAALLCAGVLGVTFYAGADEGAPATTAPPAPSPIVQVVVGESETQFDQDPFEVDRLRSSTTSVRSLLIVRADGTVERKQVRP